MVKPDHVILTFHLNDFETTPIAFFNGHRLVIYAPNKPSKELNLWLFKNSHLYRMWLGNTLDGKKDKKAIAAETKESLKTLPALLHSSDISFAVLVLPLFKTSESWKPYELEARKRIINILEELNITYFDLFETLSEAKTICTLGKGIC